MKGVIDGNDLSWVMFDFEINVVFEVKVSKFNKVKIFWCMNQLIFDILE